MKIGISSCLLGNKVRYDGTHKRNDELINLLDKHELIPVCPEIEAGFTIPREPIEIKNDKVITRNGKDVTDALISGSDKCLNKIIDCDFVILKSKSPSCGYKKIYDGNFSNNLIDGNGIFTDMCIRNNIKVFSENDIKLIREYISQ